MLGCERLPAMRGGWAWRGRGGGAKTGLLVLVGALLLTGCARGPEGAVDADPLTEGWTRYRYGEFESAIRAFERVRAEALPESPRHLQALFGLATTWNLRTPVGDQNKPLARSLYEDITRRAPEDDLAAWSLLALARMEHLVPVGADPDLARVRAAYQIVLDRFPEHLAGHEAFIYLQSTYIQTLEAAPTRRAIAALTAFIDSHPGSGFLSGAHQLLSVGYETLGDPDAQLAAELQTLDTMEFDPGNPKHENSGLYWRIATIAEFEAGDFATARRFYRRLIEEYPQDIRVFSSEEALRRMDRVEAELRAGADAGAGA